MALSVVFSWVSLCYYFDTSESYSNFYLTLKRSFITFASNVTFFFSFFIGFSVLAYCMFYHHYPFMTINYSFITLFALLWGDNFYTTVNKAFYISPLSVIFFFVTYFIIFTTFFNKVLISIVESAFESTKMRKRLYWMEKEMTFEDYIKYEYKQVLKDSDEEDEMKMNFLVETIENVVLATDKDPELYMRMQTEFLQKSGKLNKEAKKQIKKNFKRLQTLKESKEFYETLSKSYFSDPMYQPKSITVKKEGLINYKSITKQIEGICQTILQYLELFKDRLYLMEMHLTSEAEENHEEYENILQRSESECKKYYQLIDELKEVIKHHTKEIN